jgi:ribosome recycling factor
MHSFIIQSKPQFDVAIEFLHKELGALRTGRATPAIVEDIKVSAYDSTMELKGLASISTPDAKTISIDPWDKNLIRAIEKSIRDAGIGLSPVVDGSTIRILMPQLTEENRKSMVKVMKEHIEEAKVKIRHTREQMREQIQKQEKDKQISEDEKYKLLDELDKMTKEYTDNIVEIGTNKDREIMTV